MSEPWGDPFEPGDNDPTCPACEGPMSQCSCEDTLIVSALEPHWTRDGDDPNDGGRKTQYACVSCCWHQADYMAALEHHVNTAHQIEIQNMAHWGPITFPAPYVDRMRAQHKRSA